MSWERPDPRRDEDSVEKPLTSEAQRADKRPLTEHDALRDIYDAACDQHMEWMHFHEVAIADPFKAESEAQTFCRKILKLALAAGVDRGKRWKPIDVG